MEQQSWIALATGLVGGLGIGSVLTALIQYFLNAKELAQQSQRKDLESRYKVIILLMHAAHDFPSNEKILKIHRPDLNSKDDIIKELRAEWINMMLFASKPTLELLKNFIVEPSSKNLVNCALSMRKDLKRNDLYVDYEELGVEP